METMQAIASRQSCRAFTKEQITESELNTILKAANAAPVSFGYYDELKLTVIQNPELLAKINDAGSKLFRNPNIKVIYNAPTLIVVSFKTPGRIPDFLKVLDSFDNKQDPYPYCNVGCIIENMAIVSTDLGLGNVYLNGVISVLAANPELCIELKIPTDFMAGSAIAIGRAAMPLKERELTVSKIAVDRFK